MYGTLKRIARPSACFVCLGRIHADHLYELVSNARMATVLQNRAAAVARYEENVGRWYPEDRFGGEEGGLNEELIQAAADTLQRTQTADSATAFKFKNAVSENPVVRNPE